MRIDSRFYPAKLGCVLSLACFFLCGVNATPLAAQMINVGTPFNTVGDSYYERMGVNFGFSIPGGRGNGSRIVGLNPLGGVTPNINFGQNGFGSAVPQFGNYDPGASARFGFGVVNPQGGGFSLGFEMGKGSNRSVTSTVPSITVPNGYGGSIGSGALRPFVTGVVPVVFSGHQTLPRAQLIPERPVNAVTLALQSGQLDLSGSPSEPKRYEGPADYRAPASSAETSDIGVAAIKAEKARAKREQLNQAKKLVDQATEFESKRDFLNARVHLRRAMKLIQDPQWKAQVKAKLADLRGK